MYVFTLCLFSALRKLPNNQKKQLLDFVLTLIDVFALVFTFLLFSTHRKLPNDQKKQLLDFVGSKYNADALCK